MERRKVKNGAVRRSPFFTFLRATFSRPFRLSLVPTICPWVSEDELCPDEQGNLLVALKCTPRVSSLTETSFVCVTAESRHTPPFFELRTLEPPVALKASVYF